MSKEQLRGVHYLVSFNKWAGEGTASEGGTVNGSR